MERLSIDYREDSISSDRYNFHYAAIECRLHGLLCTTNVKACKVLNN